MRLKKEGDLNKKDVKHGRHAISFEKDAFWFSNLKNNINYTIFAPQYFQIWFWYKNLFLLFVSP
jgi:hypothetical protein